MKAQAQQVNQVMEASGSNAGGSSDSDSDDYDEEKSPQEARRFASNRRGSRCQRARDEDESARQDGDDLVRRAASKKVFASDTEDRLGTRRDRVKRQTKPSKKPKVPLTTSWVRDSLSASSSRGEESPSPAPREDSPLLSVTSSPGQLNVRPTVSDPDPMTVRDVLKRLQNITEYLDLWTYRCEILAEEADEQREQSESLYLLMEQARRNWQAVSSERMEKLESILHLSPRR
ncbi:hypothetical protein LTR95_005982 [Oleoguttula sp. CCFEE 5521]